MHNMCSCAILIQDAAPENACGWGTGNKYIISHGLTLDPEFTLSSIA